MRSNNAVQHVASAAFGQGEEQQRFAGSASGRATMMQHTKSNDRSSIPSSSFAVASSSSSSSHANASHSSSSSSARQHRGSSSSSAAGAHQEFASDYSYSSPIPMSLSSSMNTNQPSSSSYQQPSSSMVQPPSSSSSSSQSSRNNNAPMYPSASFSSLSSSSSSLPPARVDDRMMPTQVMLRQKVKCEPIVRPPLVYDARSSRTSTASSSSFAASSSLPQPHSSAQHHSASSSLSNVDQQQRDHHHRLRLQREKQDNEEQQRILHQQKQQQMYADHQLRQQQQAQSQPLPYPYASYPPASYPPASYPPASYPPSVPQHSISSSQPIPHHHHNHMQHQHSHPPPLAHPSMYVNPAQLSTPSQSYVVHPIHYAQANCASCVPYPPSCPYHQHPQHQHQHQHHHMPISAPYAMSHGPLSMPSSLPPPMMSRPLCGCAHACGCMAASASAASMDSAPPPLELPRSNDVHNDDYDHAHDAQYDPSSSSSSSVAEPSVPSPPSYRANATLGKSNNLNAYLDITSSLATAKMQTPKKHRTIKMKVEKSSSSDATKEPKKSTSAKKASSKSKKQKVEVLNKGDVRIRSKMDASSSDDDDDDDESDDVRVVTPITSALVNEDAIASSSSAAPPSSSSSSSAAPRLSSNNTKFNSLFSVVHDAKVGFSMHAVGYAKKKHSAIDLSSVDGTAIDSIQHCIAISNQYSMSIFNQDMSTNYRVATKEQKKYRRDHYGGVKRKQDTSADDVWSGGVKPPSMLIIKFYKLRGAIKGDSAMTQASSSPPSSSSSSSPLILPTSSSSFSSSSSSSSSPPVLVDVDMSTLDPLSPVLLNPYPHHHQQLDCISTFVLPLSRPIKMIPSSLSNDDVLLQMHHNWLMRDVFVSLFQNPPHQLHGLIFDAKAVVCAILVHYHVSNLDVTVLPQLHDIKLASWLVDSDDHRSTGYDMSKLFASHCPDQSGARGRLNVADAGDRDIDIMMQDMSDGHHMWDELVRLMMKEKLVQAFIRQEIALLPVMIDMQLRGVAVNLELFEQATATLQFKMKSLCESSHRILGYPFLLSSSDQVAKVLFDHFKCPPPKLTDRGRSQAKQKMHLTTNDNALRDIIRSSNNTPGARRVAEDVLTHRAYNKILTGYLNPLRASTVSDSHLLLTAASHQLHICANWNQASTGTGRLSCRNPNLQALPRGSMKQGLTADAAEDDDDEKDVDDDEDDNPVNTAREARSIVLPTDVNIRSAIVPTGTDIVNRMRRQRYARWDPQQNRVIDKSGAIVSESSHVSTKSSSALSSSSSSASASSSSIDQTTDANEPRIFLSADYSQMEVRLLAQLCRDTNLIRVFDPSYQPPSSSSSTPASAPAASSAAAMNSPVIASVGIDASSLLNSGDVYYRMGSIMFHKPIDQVTAAERNTSKTIVLGVMYGMGAESLAGRLTKSGNAIVSKSDAQNYIKRLYQQFPGINTFMSGTRAQANAKGFVLTLIARRRYLPDLHSSTARTEKRAYAERQAVNTVIQGSAADMTKMSMIGLHSAIRSSPLLRSSVWLSLQLHDEIILELPSRLLSQVATLVRTIMEGILPSANVPFTVNIKIGSSIGDMKAWSEDDENKKGDEEMKKGDEEDGAGNA